MLILKNLLRAPNLIHLDMSRQKYLNNKIKSMK